MSKEISQVVNFWKEEVSEHIKRYAPYHVSQQLKQMAALFSPGTFYYYILNFHNLEMEYVHEGTEEVLGIKPEEFSMQKLLTFLPPDELNALANKEALAADFLFNFLSPDEMPFYKVVYFFQAHDTSGKFHNMLHQATTLTISETGKVEHVLGVQTDITHLSLARNNKVSFISLDGGPSYYNLNPEQSEKFDPANSCPTGAYAKLFTKRELEVIKLFAEGLTAAQVGERLNVTMHTIRTHRKNVLEKTDCANMTELVARCVVEGVV